MLPSINHRPHADRWIAIGLWTILFIFVICPWILGWVHIWNAI